MNYATVSTTGVGTVTAATMARLHTRPWTWGVQVTVSAGRLMPGDVVKLTIGDTSGGSPGARAQSFDEPDDRVGGAEVCLAGGLDRAVCVQWLADEPLTSDVDVQFTPRLQPGRHAFFVRVTQEDGHRAWSSPLFIDCPLRSPS